MHFDGGLSKTEKIPSNVYSAVSRVETISSTAFYSNAFGLSVHCTAFYVSPVARCCCTLNSPSALNVCSHGLCISLYREYRFTLENVVHFFFVTLRTDNENKTHKKQIMKTHEKWPTMKRRSQKRWCFRLFHISALRDQTLAAMTHATLYVRHDDDRPESLVFTFFGIWTNSS